MLFSVGNFSEISQFQSGPGDGGWKVAPQQRLQRLTSPFSEAVVLFATRLTQVEANLVNVAVRFTHSRRQRRLKIMRADQSKTKEPVRQPQPA